MILHPLLLHPNPSGVCEGGDSQQEVCLIPYGEENWPVSWASHLPLIPSLQRWEFQRILISN